jgi:hypothetical protein
MPVCVDLVTFVHVDHAVVRDQRAERVALACVLDAGEPQRRQQVRADALVDAGWRVGAVANGLADQQRFVPLVRLPEQLALGREHVLAAEMSASAGRRGVDLRRGRCAGRDAEQTPDRHGGRERRGVLVVGVVAVARVVDRREAEGEGVTQRDVERGLDVGRAGTVVVLTVTGLDLGGVLIELGPLRRDRDHAAGRVLAEQRPLRSAVHLDLLRIEERQELRRDVREHELVDEKADGRILRDQDDVRAGPAHAAAGRVESGGVRQHEARRDLSECADVVERDAAELLLADREIAIGTSCCSSSRLMPVTMISSRPLLAASAGGAVEAACAWALAGVTSNPSVAVPSAAATATASVRDVVFMRRTPCCETARITPALDVVTGKTGLCGTTLLPERSCRSGSRVAVT